MANVQGSNKDQKFLGGLRVCPTFLIADQSLSLSTAVSATELGAFRGTGGAGLLALRSGIEAIDLTGLGWRFTTDVAYSERAGLLAGREPLSLLTGGRVRKDLRTGTTTSGSSAWLSSSVGVAGRRRGNTLLEPEYSGRDRTAGGGSGCLEDDAGSRKILARLMGK